jgi:acetoacetyl-CoA synthetase
MTTSALLWQPSAERIAKAGITHFARALTDETGIAFPDYPSLWRWSIANKEAFWRALWDYCGVIGTRGERTLIDGERMPGARWFPDARLNFAENLLTRRPATTPAMRSFFAARTRSQRRVSHAELVASVAKVAAALKAEGISPGDRIAGYLPNMPEAIIAMLATASLGAVWSSCSPDFGVAGVLDRFSQIEPKVLFAVDGYWYNGKALPIADKVADIVSGLPTARRVVVVPYLQQSGGLAADVSPIRGAVQWDRFADRGVGGTIEYARMPFDHPLYILYSSGTTGCQVHCPRRRRHVVAAHEGAPAAQRCPGRRSSVLFHHLRLDDVELAGVRARFGGDIAAVRWLAVCRARPDPLGFRRAERMTHFGTSAKYIDASKKIALVPRKDYALGALRTMLSTGSPLSPDSFDYVYQCVKHDLCLSSISGGTDIISCFALGAPTLPVWRGELQCRGLGMAVDVFDDSGKPVRGEKGELVCTAPFPSMPIGFWNDSDGSKYRAAYFERFPSVWCHADYVELTEHDGMIFYGRSDATLNPGGVRIGTGGDLPPGRGDGRDRREPGHRPGLAPWQQRRYKSRALCSPA